MCCIRIKHSMMLDTINIEQVVQYFKVVSACVLHELCNCAVVGCTTKFKIADIRYGLCLARAILWVMLQFEGLACFLLTFFVILPDISIIFIVLIIFFLTCCLFQLQDHSIWKFLEIILGEIIYSEKVGNIFSRV